MIELKKTQNGIEMASREIPVAGQWDVVVVGGGMGGVGAAMAAGKRGWKTLLIESMGALGGLATMGLVNIPLDFVSGLGVEMIDELEKIDGHWHRNTDPEKHKLVLDRMLEKYGCDVLLQITVIDSIVENGAIAGVIVQTKTGPAAILARRVVDASGDSDAAFFAGARTVSGRPGDGMSQACSLEFTLGGVDWDAYLSSELKKTDPKWIRTIRTALENGDLPYEVDNHLNWITHLPGRPQHCGRDEVSICLAHSRNCFPLRMGEMSRMFREGREQVDFLVRFIKKYIPGFENCYMSATASMMGVRESRRVIGEYVLTAEDIAHLRKFDDVICISTHGYDVHNYDGPGNIKWAEMEIDGRTQYVICNAGGFGATTPPPNGMPVVNVRGESMENAVFETNGYYDIPYRCLVPEKLDNLLVAGRNLSSDVNAQSGSRLILACLNMGEAAGTAMAISLAENIRPRDVNVKALQAELIASGCNIGQNMRAIPGIDPAATFEDRHANPELVGRNRRRGGYERSLEEVSAPWEKK